MVSGGFVLWFSISGAARGRAAVETWVNEVLRCLGGGELAGCDAWWFWHCAGPAPVSGAPSPWCP